MSLGPVCFAMVNLDTVAVAVALLCVCWFESKTLIFRRHSATTLQRSGQAPPQATLNACKAARAYASGCLPASPQPMFSSFATVSPSNTPRMMPHARSHSDAVLLS